MKKRNWLLRSLRKKKKKGKKKNFSESEKYRVYVLRDKKYRVYVRRDNVSTVFNIVTVIILRGTICTQNFFQKKVGFPLSGQHKHTYIK